MSATKPGGTSDPGADKPATVEPEAVELVVTPPPRKRRRIEFTPEPISLRMAPILLVSCDIEEVMLEQDLLRLLLAAYGR